MRGETVDSGAVVKVPTRTGRQADGLGTQLQVSAFEGDIGIQGMLLLCVLVCSCV